MMRTKNKSPLNPLGSSHFSLRTRTFFSWAHRILCPFQGGHSQQPCGVKTTHLPFPAPVPARSTRNNGSINCRTLAAQFLAEHHRPLVTVSYAQSVDGSIATRNREQLRLSGHQSMVVTHRIRAACDAIVIGINTLLIDNPLLTVRLADGPNPQPIVLDSQLRIPLQARLLERTDLGCWVACTENGDPERISAVENQGAEVIRCRHDRQGRVDLPHLLQQLGERGISSIMVEGGGQVISSFH
jgi:riboflavin-specific deaminase-like protein